MKKLSFATLMMLIVVGSAGLWWITPAQMPATAKVILNLFLYLPLAIFLPACWSADKRWLTWLCFILLFYFCGYVTQLLDPAPVRTLAIAKTSLTVVLFVLAMLNIRAPVSND